MENLLVLTISCLLFAFGKNPRPEVVVERFEKTEAIPAKEKFKVTDTANDTIPAWVKKMYPRNRMISGEEVIETQRISEFHRLNDSISWCILEVASMGICAMHFLAVQSNQEELEQAEIGRGCNHYFSLASYKWKTFERLKPNLFQITKHTEYAPPEFVDFEGRMIEGRSFDDQENLVDSVVQMVRINPNGELTVENQGDTIPYWLAETYPDEYSPWKGATPRWQSIDNFFQVNDSLSWCLLSVSAFGICEISELASQVNKKETHRVEMVRDCDSDIFAAQYQWSTYNLIDPTSHKVVQYTKTALPKYTDGDGAMLEGYDIDEVESTLDSTVQYFKINPNGIILKQ